MLASPMSWCRGWWRALPRSLQNHSGALSLLVVLAPAAQPFPPPARAALRFSTCNCSALLQHRGQQVRDRDPLALGQEREFSLSPIIRSGELGPSRRDVLHRLDTLAEELGLDRERARLWAFGQTIAWGFENGKALDSHIEVARWLLAG